VLSFCFFFNLESNQHFKSVERDRIVAEIFLRKFVSPDGKEFPLPSDPLFQLLNQRFSHYYYFFFKQSVFDQTRHQQIVVSILIALKTLPAVI
jgi:hypothetical protein